MADDTGYGSETMGCNLPSLFDNEDEEGYFDDGVEFYVNNKEVKVCFEFYVKCIELACKIYIDENGNDEIVDEALKTIR